MPRPTTAATTARCCAKASIHGKISPISYLVCARSNYGVHWMLNVLVKGKENGFVLIRALEPTRGIALMRKRRDVHDVHRLCSGPGKLTEALAITGRYDEMDLCGNENHCFRERLQPIKVIADERIGIRLSAHLPWRFTLRDSAHLSRKVRSSRRQSRDPVAKALR